jgi:squalene synthase HpnC
MAQAAFAQSLAEFGPGSAEKRLLTVEEANAYCRRLAANHYENFTVVSWLLPRHLRQHFCNVYAYCRWADDLADETGDSDRATELLSWWESQLSDCYEVHRNQALHPVFVALTETIREFDLPVQPFYDLLAAFRQDQTVTRYETAADVLDYCRRSANPVGQLVLRLGRVSDAESFRLSDEICTGLQLANFCQDVANDWDRGRVYLPQELLRAESYNLDDFERRMFSPAFRAVMQSAVANAESHLRAGEPLVHRAPAELRFDISLFLAGGLAISEKIRQQDYNVWAARPALSKFDKMRIAAKAWWKSRSPRG